MKKYPLLLSLSMTFCAIAVSSHDRKSNDPDLIPDQYIVTLKDDANMHDVLAGHGLAPIHRYSHTMHGFAAQVPSGQLKMLKKDWRVRHVEADRIVKVVGRASLPSKTVTASSEVVPTGVNRVNAELNPRRDVSSVGIAIIDTGIDLRHADLNVSGHVSFVPKIRSGNDDNGHGTHVAGIAAAKADGFGVRGVAPNARLYAVKVLNYNGSGQLSWVIKGVDWVTQNAAAKGIKVANMSLGLQGTSLALDSSISASVRAGVTYVVAAGNNSSDAAFFSPASHPQVITVSAIADSDGQHGGLGAATPYGSDDMFASFSNRGQVISLAAPGVNIFSTYKNGLYATMSGTSMAAPAT